MSDGQRKSSREELESRFTVSETGVYQCTAEDCGRQFSTVQALHMHYQRSHLGMNAHTGGRKKYPSDYTRNQYEVLPDGMTPAGPSGNSRGGRKPGSKNRAKSNGTLNPVEGFRIFTDDEGHIWLAERIR